MPSKSLYGTCDAGQNWERGLQGFLADGLRREGSSTSLFSQGACGACAAARGDDATIQAPQHKAEWLKRVLEKRYEIKTQVIGGEADLEKDLRMLNRTYGGARDDFGSKQMDVARLRS